MPAQRDLQTILDELIRRVNEDSRRLRILEERALAIENRAGSAEDAILRNAESFRSDLEKIAEQFRDFDARLMRLENEAARLAKEAEKSAKKIEIKELENLISLYNPITSKFVTKDEVEKMIKK